MMMKSKAMSNHDIVMQNDGTKPDDQYSTVGSGIGDDHAFEFKVGVCVKHCSDKLGEVVEIEEEVDNDGLIHRLYHLQYDNGDNDNLFEEELRLDLEVIHQNTPNGECIKMEASIGENRDDDFSSRKDDCYDVPPNNDNGKEDMME